jgi:hypothetical protein
MVATYSSWRRSTALLSKIFDLHMPYLATSTHLRIEFALWACTVLLASASSTVLYRNSYLSTYGDWTFMLWVGTWLGRHFLVRLACTLSWICPPRSPWGEGGGRNGRLGGGWRRRRKFETWLHRQRGGGSGAVLGGYGRYSSSSSSSSLSTPSPAIIASIRRQCHRMKWIIRLLLSPYDAFSRLLKSVQYCGMAGQYCDASAANGVASAAMVMLPGGVVSGLVDVDHHHFPMSTTRGGGGGSSFGGHGGHHHHHHPHSFGGRDHHLVGSSSHQSYGVAGHADVMLSLAMSW